MRRNTSPKHLRTLIKEKEKSLSDYELLTDSVEDRWVVGAKVFTRTETTKIIIDQRKRIYNKIEELLGQDAANLILTEAGTTKF